MRTRTVRPSEVDDALIARWRALCAKDLRAAVFQGPDVALGWAHVSGGESARVILAEDAEGLAGVMAVFVWDGRVLLAGTGPLDIGDVVVRPGAEAAVLAALAREIEAYTATMHGREIAFEQVPAERALVGLPLGDSWRREVRSGVVCPWLALGGELGLANVPLRMRRSLAQSRRALSSAGRLTFDWVSGDAAVDGLEALVSALAHRWGAASALNDPLTRAATREMVRRADASETLRFLRCSVDDAAVGWILGLRTGADLWLYLQGAKPGWERQGVGAVMIAQAAARAHEEGLHRLQFLRGDEAYKAAWGAGGGATVNVTWTRA